LIKSVKRNPDQADLFKDFGVIFQSVMSFEMHTATQINKANNILGIIK